MLFLITKKYGELLKSDLGRRIFSIVFVVFCLGAVARTPCFAFRPQQVKPSQFPKLASFEILLSARPLARRHYLNQLRLLVIDLSDSRVRGSGGSFVQTHTSTSEFMTLMQVVIPHAHAEPLDPPEIAPLPPSRPDELRDLCLDTDKKFNWTEDAKKCVAERKEGEVCIFAGNVLKYKKMRDGKGDGVGCPLPNTICSDTFEPPSDGEPCKGRKIKCKKEMAICNPLLFGLTKDGGPLCAPAQSKEAASKASRACYELAYQQEHNNNTAQAKDPGNDDLDVGNTAAKESAYKRLQAAVESICNSDTVKTQGNCTACSAARGRIKAMNSVLKEKLSLKNIKAGEIPTCQGGPLDGADGADGVGGANGVPSAGLGRSGSNTRP